jgi:hypothetical protein
MKTSDRIMVLIIVAGIGTALVRAVVAGPQPERGSAQRIEARKAEIAELDSEIAAFVALTNELAAAGNNAHKLNAALYKWATGCEKAAKHKKKGKPSAGLK